MTDTIEEKNVLLDEAIDFVAASVEEKEQCPFCGWKNATASNKEKALATHLRSGHKHKSMLAYEQKTLDPILRTEPDGSAYEQAGVEVLDELDKPDYLRVDPAVRADVEAQGDALRWTSPERISYWLNQGATPVPYTGPDFLKNQQSTEDGAARSGELRLVRIPKSMVKKRAAIKARTQENSLRARGEERPGGGMHSKHKDDIGQSLVNTFLKEGKDRATAQQLADAAVRGLEKGVLGQNNASDGYLRVSRG